MTPSFLLILLFLLSIGHLITLKLCSARIDHRAVPLFVSLWMLAGLAAAADPFAAVAARGWAAMAEAPVLAALAVLKGGLMYGLFLFSQRLTQESLSSRHYVTPLTVAAVAGINAGLGERLTGAQWASVLGLTILAAAFFCHGHLAALGPETRRTYLRLAGLSIIISVLDHALTRAAGWYAPLLLANGVLLAVAVALHRGGWRGLTAPLFHPAAVAAGAFYLATELVKFYQLVSINPVSVVLTVQAATKPVILLLAAWLWKERTVKEQLAWGLSAFVVTLPLFL